MSRKWYGFFNYLFYLRAGRIAVFSGLQFSGLYLFYYIIRRQKILNGKLAHKISKDTWVQNGKAFEYDEFPGRPAANICIGMDINGDEKYFIYEPIFLDVLPLIIDHKVTAHVNLYTDPQLVCETRGQLIIHNGDIPVIKDELDLIIDDMAEENKIRAITEIRQNRYSTEKIGPITKILRKQLTASLPKGVLLDGKMLNYEYMKLYLRDKYRLDDKPEEDSLEEKIRMLSKEDLISLQGGIMEYTKTGRVRFEPFKSLVEEYKADKIEEAYKNELEYRFYLGTIS